jgi:ankyrin repeat protein
MAKYVALVLAVLLFLALGGRYFLPLILPDWNHASARQSAEIYRQLEHLATNDSMGKLFDELQVAADAKIDLNHRNAAGLRALDIAASNNQWNAAAAFIVAGSSINDVDSNGDTVMHIAVRHHALHVLKELLRFLPDLNRHNKAGLTPIDLAHQLNDDAAAALLTAPFTSG